MKYFCRITNALTGKSAETECTKEQYEAKRECKDMIYTVPRGASIGAYEDCPGCPFINRMRCVLVVSGIVHTKLEYFARKEKEEIKKEDFSEKDMCKAAVALGVMLLIDKMWGE